LAQRVGTTLRYRREKLNIRHHPIVVLRQRIGSSDL
jgi:hypothetical protein